MKEKMKWNDYDSLPLILDVTDIQHIMGISRASAYELDSGGNSHENEKEKTA